MSLQGFGFRRAAQDPGVVWELVVEILKSRLCGQEVRKRGSSANVGVGYKQRTTHCRNLGIRQTQNGRRAVERGRRGWFRAAARY